MRPVLRIGLGVALLGYAAGLSAQSGSSQDGSSVRGTVYDSVARRPLRDAAVRLVSVRDTTVVRNSTTDSTGRFEIAAASAGPWIAIARHPRLDSLALRELVVPVTVRGGRTRITMAVPSARALARRVCGVNETDADSSGFLVGRIRRAVRGEPFVAGTVRVQWLELALTGAGPTRELVSVEATTGQDGAFLACGVPINAFARIRAVSSADSSGYAQLNFPATGIIYRDVYVGAAVAVDVPIVTVGRLDRAERSTDTTDVPVSERYWRGPGSIAGVIRDARGQPLPNARVQISAAGRETRTDVAGRFRLDSLPMGTQGIDVRAIGFEPVSDAVDVVEMAAPFTFSMARLLSLDTVRIRAMRARIIGPRMVAFEQRRRMGIGKFFGPEELDELNPVRISDVFSRVAGIVMVWNRYGERIPTMRASGGGRCVPTILVDGFEYRTDAPLDAFFPTESVTAVEVYSAAFIPGEFSRPFAACGTIVVWTGERANVRGK